VGIKIEVSASIVRLISLFLSNGKFRVLNEGRLSMPPEIQAGIPQGSVLSPTLYSFYVNDIPIGVHLALFADDKSMYIYNRLQRLCSQKAAMWPNFSGVKT
jgi:hypothetical protein